MDTASFEDFLDRYGGDLAGWPEPERAAAAALLARAPEARALLAEMQAVEAVLRRPDAVVDAGAIDRIAARATRHRQETRARLFAVRAGLGATAAAVLALGVLIGGTMTPAPVAHDLNPDRVVANALDAGGAGDVE